MKKGLGNIITLALSLINLVMTLVLVFAVVPANNKTAKMVDKICDIVDLSIGEEKEDNSGEVGIQDLEVVTVLFDEGKTSTVASLSDKLHVAKISVTINVNKKSEDYDKLIGSVSTAMSIIDSEIINAVSEFSADTVSKVKLEESILNKLKVKFGSNDFIHSVTLNQYVISKI